MSFELKYAPKFGKLFRKLERKVQARILKQIFVLASDPFQGKHLHGSLKGKLSLKVGDYRVIYKVEENVVYLLAVGHRKKIYTSEQGAA